VRYTRVDDELVGSVASSIATNLRPRAQAGRCEPPAEAIKKFSE
jgi:hypothetical protein